ncbi:Pyruvate dehydrogenase E1 component subunit alpha [Haloferax mediterranei ATCC 33500]|uniref:2-oxo acid dehydrogenase n=1 Tax=Haloferax mediterranei (strain ATCC 33500 / DSM 1411 / JCM 8866 / NBRC 14739 / NCIMB 2177 / R-4) TaxID=523841 RepID=I3R6U4_HALMT|nr:thiamine pyrophosphate-dependent enzyme [Haloferax mediterranei]AFK19954.1 Pyruvate dehydrogenase E1 component subunit alpha [Haloferax mediterranei ATCC 33500]AHZ23330.1 2-oxo acid dehydrogenase [Haloferax mediterranei ATCC 33500]ELZ99498.1 Pyruvate dehydrogenase E1 component subunit alpha [Haloferax mediterranei ATCC 33500]MDX5987297.1 thiamine pyrophosphate-dependent enzyme [Haloferax mediterranei ATCC 33500]
MHRLIAERGLDGTGFTAEDARTALRDMIRARRFDERALALQRRGWMSGYPPFHGQEASQIGAAHAMREDDVLLPTYRSNAFQIARGVPPSDLLLFRRGHAEYTSDHDVPVFPQAVPIASQIPHAAGVGMAADYRDDDYAALACFGDGATSEGDFHEGLNFAGVFDAPVVFFCENNGWAISLPRDRQTASESIAAKAEAYGIEGMQVDGNDPLAVRGAVEKGLEKARNGEPVLIESLTYRQGPHTTADDPSRYRDDDPDLPEWRTRDPVERFEEFCREHDIADDDLIESMYEEANEELREAIEIAEETPEPGTEELFGHIYEELPPELARQREEHVEFIEEHGPFDIER